MTPFIKLEIECYRWNDWMWDSMRSSQKREFEYSLEEIPLHDLRDEPHLAYIKPRQQVVGMLFD